MNDYVLLLILHTDEEKISHCRIIVYVDSDRLTILVKKQKKEHEGYKNN